MPCFNISWVGLSCFCTFWGNSKPVFLSFIINVYITSYYYKSIVITVAVSCDKGR